MAEEFDFTIDPRQYDEPTSGSFEALDTGDYRMEVLKVSTHTTNAGDGGYIKVQFVVRDGKYDGRHLFQNFNIHNPKNADTTEKWARESYASLCRAAGFGESPMDNPQQLEDRLVIGHVIRKKSKNPNYPDDVNDIRAFDDVDAVPAKTGSSAASSQPRKSFASPPPSAPAASASTAPAAQEPHPASESMQGEPAASTTDDESKPAWKR